MAGKPLATSTDYGVRVLMSKLSHNLLADLVIALVRDRLRSPDLDGAALCKALVEHAADVAKSRRDRLPAADVAERDLLATLKAGNAADADVIRAWLLRERGITA